MNRNYFKKILFGIYLYGTLNLLTACSTLPVYEAEQAQEISELNVVLVGDSWVCFDSTQFILKHADGGYATIPSGRKITIGNYHKWDGYGSVYYSCNPSLSFVPKAGERYFLNREIKKDKCFLEIYREGANNRVGLEKVESVGASDLSSCTKI
jgi:hypothetical protein